VKAIAQLPRLAIEAGGVPLAAEDQGSLEEVRVHHRLSAPSQCELVFVNPRGILAADALSLRGGSLRLTGDGFAEPLFEGEVTSIEHRYGPSATFEVRLRAYDRLHRLRKSQPVRAHVQTTLRDLTRELAAGLGVRIEASEDGPLFDRLIQYRQSDLDLLIESAERCGLFLSLRGSVLHVLTLEGIGAQVPLKLGENLFEANVEVNGEPACRSVVASGWDPSRVEHHEGRAARPRVGRDVAAEFGPGSFGADGERSLAAEILHHVTHAEAIAQAELDIRVASEVTLSGATEGDPRLLPGARIQVTGLSTQLNGRYVLTEVVHRVNRQSGFISEISTVPPRRRPRSRASSTAQGIVTRVDDPANLGRVCVSLPEYGDIETDWMSVVSTGAGGGKGFVILPDVGDQVLLLFPQEDPSLGVVLGGLYGSKCPPDNVVEGGAIRRYSMRTGGGQRVILDDEAKRIRLESANGSYVELSPERLQIHSVTPIEIEAIGQPLTIRGKAINFEEA
jgi:phage baseplate assembly protein V